MEVACNMVPMVAPPPASSEASSNSNGNNLNSCVNEIADNTNSSSNTFVQNESRSAKLVQHHDQANGNIQTERNTQQQQTYCVNNNNVNQNNHNNNNNNNNNNHNSHQPGHQLPIREQEILHYDDEEEVITSSENKKVEKSTSSPPPVVALQETQQQQQNNNKNNHRVKFIDVPGDNPADDNNDSSGAEDNFTMNQNLASSQPLMNGGHLAGHHHHNGDLTEISQKMANSHPHVTIASHPEIPKEDRAFGSKIDNSYQGWDNPFRPEGELSHDAEEILRLWKDGKLKDFSLLLKASSSNNNSADMDKADEVDNTTTTTHSLCTPTKDSEPLLKNGTPQNGQSKSSFGVADNNGGMKGQQQPRQQSRSEKAKIGDADEPKKKQGCCALM